MITTNQLPPNNSDDESPIPFEVRPLPPELLATIDTQVTDDPEPSTSSANTSRTTEVNAQNSEEQKASKKKGSKRESQCKCSKTNDTKKRKPL